MGTLIALIFFIFCCLMFIMLAGQIIAELFFIHGEMKETEKENNTNTHRHGNH